MLVDVTITLTEMLKISFQEMDYIILLLQRHSIERLL